MVTFLQRRGILWILNNFSWLEVVNLKKVVHSITRNYKKFYILDTIFLKFHKPRQNVSADFNLVLKYNNNILKVVLRLCSDRPENIWSAVSHKRKVVKVYDSQNGDRYKEIQTSYRIFDLRFAVCSLSVPNLIRWIETGSQFDQDLYKV